MAVSRAFLKRTSAAIDIRFYANLSGRTVIRRGNLDRVDREAHDYILFTNVLYVEESFKERDEYWCQVLVNGRDTYDSVVIQRSSATVIRMPSCYKHLPLCARYFYLGHSDPLDAFSPSLPMNDICRESTRDHNNGIPSSGTLIAADNTTMPCNTKDDAAGVAVIVLSVLLVIFVVLTLVLAFVLVLGTHWKHNKTKKKGKTLIMCIEQ